MASKDMIIALLSEAAVVTVRSYSPTDVETLAEPFIRQMSGTSDKAIQEAFDSWLSSFGESAPKSLPLPSHIWKHHETAAQRNSPDTVARGYERPRPEFVDAMSGIAEQLHSIGQGLGSLSDRLERDVWVAHKHVTPEFDRVTGETVTTGREDCRACQGQERRRTEIAVVLAQAPTPMDPKPYACKKCHDEGWVETKVSKANRTSLVWTGPTEVYPCPDCRPEQFHDERKRWQGGGGDEAA